MRQVRQQFVKTWNPSHPADSKRMKVLNCVTSDIWADICPRCSG